MMNGNAGKYSVTKTELGKTLSTGFPVKIDEKTKYFALIVTNTKSLYSGTESAL
jgi:hypothetical protein